MSRPPNVSPTNPGHAYEVVGIRHDGTEEPIGWTDDPEGGSLLAGVKLWPRYKNGEVRPAQPEKEQ